MSKEKKADILWGQIKNLPLDIYALPDQTVEMHVKRVEIEPDKIHMILKSGVVLPALEEALKAVKLPPTEMFSLENQGTFTVLKTIPKIV